MVRERNLLFEVASVRQSATVRHRQVFEEANLGANELGASLLRARPRCADPVSEARRVGRDRAVARLT